MNEFLQQSMKAACGVKIEFDVVEWQILLNAARMRRTRRSCAARMRSMSVRHRRMSA